nr:DMT family transporter [Acuticoccus mangrovi]
MIFAANILLPLQDALAKDYVAVLPVWQVLLVRSLTVLLLAAAIGRGPLLRRLPVARSLPAMLVRSLVNLAAWGLFYLALRDLPLAQGITLYFFSPVLVALMAGPLLGERAGRAHWIGIVVGFAGVALASGAARLDMSAAAGLGILAAAFWAVTTIMLRVIAVGESALVQVTVANAVFAVATGTVALVVGWQANGAQTLGLALAGIAGGAGQYAIYAAARRISATTLAALEYGALVSGFVLGWLFFAETPTLTVWLGASLVIASGLAVVTAERRRPPSPLDRAAPVAPVTTVALAATASEAEAEAEAAPDADRP